MPMLFKQFIANLHGWSQNGCHQIVYVIGNSSVDYDSFFGSIIYAYYLTNVCNKIHIPIINCVEKDIFLRFQVKHILDLMGIKVKSFIYAQQLQQFTGNWCLYDHNLRKNINVIEVIDHHDIVQPNKIPTCNIIYPLGSALTILYYLYNPEILNNTQSSEFKSRFQTYTTNTLYKKQYYDPQIDTVIYYGILMDCFNFDKNQDQRWTKFDKLAIDTLQMKCTEHELCYQDLTTLKFSPKMNSQLSLAEHLRKDYKKLTYNTLTAEYSVITMAPNQFLECYGQQLEEWRKIQSSNILYFLMYIWQAKSKQDQFNRSIMFIATPPLVKIITNLIQSMNMQQQFHNNPWNCWMDPTATISRKLFDSKLRQHLKNNIQQ